MTPFAPQGIEDLRDYLHNWGTEFDKLRLDELEAFNLTKDSLILLSALADDAENQTFDPDEQGSPAIELLFWFVRLVDQSQSWQEIETALRHKLIADCKITPA